MKAGYTHIALILDASGSMSRVAAQTKDALKKFAREQLAAREPGERIALDVWQFNSDVKHILKNVELQAFDPDKYHCGGGTALYDAVVCGCDSLSRRFGAAPRWERPEDVVAVVVTDGYDNASWRYKLDDVRRRVERLTMIYHWRFLFLGANMDVDAYGRSLGVANARDRRALRPDHFAYDMKCEITKVQVEIRACRALKRGLHKRSPFYSRR